MNLLNAFTGKGASGKETSLSLIETILFKSDIGYHQLDKMGRVLIVNKAWLDTLGFTEEEVKGVSFSSFLSDDFREKFKKCFVLLPKNKVMENVSMELKHKEGHLVRVNFNTTVILNENGEIEKTHALFTHEGGGDPVKKEPEFISVDALADTINSRSKHDSMSEILNAMALKWRVPLDNISKIIDEARNSMSDEMCDREYIADSLGACAKYIHELSGNIETFETFFNNSAAGESFKAADAVLETINVFSKQFLYHGIDFEVICDCSLSYFKTYNEIKTHECPDHPYFIKGDRAEFNRVLMSIISNASYAVKESMVKGNVKKGVIRFIIKFDESHVDIYVSNNGGLIPEEILDRVFEPYFSTKDNDANSGLGLFVVKTIVEKNLKGQVKIENITDGVRVNLSLPLAN